MKKKVIILAILLLVVLGFSGVISASSDINVFVGGERLHLEDPPILKDGRTLAPMRHFFEALGATVSWDANTMTAIGKRGNIEVRIPIGSARPTVNGQAAIIDVPAQIINGRTYIPLRFVGEALGDNVVWEGATRTITITRGDGIPKYQPAPSVAPAPKPAAPSEGRYVGSIKSDKYHHPTCRHAKNILPENEIWFKDTGDAKAKGYVPCGVCRPPR